MCDNSVAHIDSKAVAGIASPSLGDEKEVPGSIVRRARMCCGCKSYERRCCHDQDRMLGQDSSPKQSCNLCSGRWPTHLGRSQQGRTSRPPHLVFRELLQEFAVAPGFASTQHRCKSAMCFLTPREASCAIALLK